MNSVSHGPGLLKALKAVAGAPGPQLLIPVASPPVAWLRVVPTRPEFINPTDVACLTLWRNRFVTSFLTEFEATHERTRQWLTEVVGPSDGKILFMLDGADGRPFGYMGIASINWETASAEADAIVRGGDAPRGTMRIALHTLLAWARHHLELRELGVRVRSDNPAVLFYEKIGFREQRRVPLRRSDNPHLIQWSEDPSALDSQVHLVHMLFTSAQS